ncbi:MAG: double zinc ribbon domain-containing protein [Ktedonobacteraceae bacterium]
MTPCTSCGSDVTGKKFCQNCGTPVQATGVPATNNHPAPAFCSSCGRQGAPGERFCSNCGTQLGIATPAQPAQTGYTQPGQSSPQYPPQQPYPSQYGQQPDYAQQQSYSQPQYPPQQQPYGQPQYPPQQPAYGQPQYPPQPYGQPQYPQGQGGYQPQPMVGQQPMILRCPVCMAMSPVGTPNCPSCRTNLAGVVPTPANMPQQNQQGGIMGSLGGMMQGNGGKYAMGALGGAAAVIGGEMLLGGVEHHIERGIEGDMGYDNYGERRHHDEGMLGGLGEIGRDIGLF